MRQISGTTIYSFLDTELGYLVEGACDNVGSGLPTTTLTFASGAKIVDRSTKLVWRNVGDPTTPVWESEIMSKTVTLSAAEIFTLYSVGKEIIPAMPGKIIVLDSFVFDLTGTATQFTGGGVVNLQWGSTVNGAGTTLHADIAATVVQNATARVVTVRIPKDQSAIATASVTGLPVWIGSKTADFAVGTGTAVVKVKYHYV